MEEYLRTLLLGLGHPVAWGGLGSGTTLPRIMLTQVSGSEELSLNGPSGVIRGRIQVDCFGATTLQATQVAREVHGLLSGHKGGPILLARLVGIRGGHDGTDGDAIPVISRDFAVTYRD